MISLDAQEEHAVPQEVYVPSQSYRICRRVCYVLASASAQLAIAIHLIICKPTLFRGRDNMRVFAGEALLGEWASLSGCKRLDRDGALRRLVLQRGQVIVWKGPGTEVRNNRVWF